MKGILSLLPLILFFLLQGCGIGVWTIGDHSASVGELTLSQTKGQFVIAGKPNNRVFDSDFLLNQWGEPNSREQNDGGEIWEYRLEGWRWHGVIIDILFIPIPLLAPFGRDYVTLVLKDGKVKSAKRTGSDITFGWFCGYTGGLVHQKGPWYCEYEFNPK